jgi:hypothetical protein
MADGLITGERHEFRDIYDAIAVQNGEIAMEEARRRAEAHVSAEPTPSVRVSAAKNGVIVFETL